MTGPKCLEVVYYGILLTVVFETTHTAHLPEKVPQKTTPTTTPAPPKVVNNCSSFMKPNPLPAGVINVKLLPSESLNRINTISLVRQEVEQITNCSDGVGGPTIERKTPSETDSWKTKMIIGSTITIALEILVMIVIVLHWRQIRWSLRKITCPCDDRDRQRGERMERSENNSSPHSSQSLDVEIHHVNTNTDLAIPGTSHDPHLYMAIPGTSATTYSVPRHRETVDVHCWEDDSPEPVPSTSRQYSGHDTPVISTNRDCLHDSPEPGTSRDYCPGSPVAGTSKQYSGNAGPPPRGFRPGVRGLRDSDSSDSDFEHIEMPNTHSVKYKV